MGKGPKKLDQSPYTWGIDDVSVSNDSTGGGNTSCGQKLEINHRHPKPLTLNPRPFTLRRPLHCDNYPAP